MKTIFDAFISYGRADSLAFGRKLYQRLREEGLNIWFDQNDIPLGVDFQNQIDDGIEKADNFLFIIAPHSINSPYCGKEIELAIRRNKRIIPLLHVEEIDRHIWQKRKPQGTDEEWEAYKAKGLHSCFQNMHQAIGKINWVYFREGIDDFDKSFTGLLELLNRHADYVEKHTQLLTKALEWERQQKQNRWLLVGDEKKQAEAWLKIHFNSEQPPCFPTDLHCEYITESIKNGNNLMTQVFISYSEQDRETMEKIRNSLRRESLTVWTNTTDIQTGEDFQRAIDRGIEQTDNLIYLVSPDSVESEFVRKELDYAVSLHKRLIPILVRETPPESIPKALQGVQYIDLTDNVKEDDYLLDESQLLKIIHQDEVYYNEHKVFLTQALKWERQHRNPSILLRGYNLRSAEAWLKVGQKRTQHRPTALIEEFIAESLRQPPLESLDVFISYSRVDSDLARKLNNGLQLQGKTTWFDQESIASGADFAREIEQGIQSSDNFLFILSPQSVNSPYCAMEVEYAAKLNKRFVTLLHRPVNSADLHPELAKVQWIDFNQNEGDFNANFNQLVRTLDTDREHLQNHTKWSQRAWEWNQKNQTKDLLLRGSELAIAEVWLKDIQEQKKQPVATELQKAYIAKSSAEKRKNKMLLRGGVVGALSVTLVTIAAASMVWLMNMVSRVNRLEQNAGGAQSLLDADPLEALIRVIQATGQTEDKDVDWPEMLPQLQSSLHDATGDARERNLLTASTLPVTSLALSPDGQILASAGFDGTIRLWDTSGNPIGQPMDPLPNWRTPALHSVAWSPDGKTIVSGDAEGTIRLWDISGKLMGQRLKGHQGEVLSIRFSPDGKTIVSSGEDGTIRLWDTSGNRVGEPFKGHEGGIRSIALSPDGKTIVSGGEDKTVRLWTRQGQLIGQPWTGHEDEVASVAWSPDGKTIASGSYDGRIRLWNTEGKLIGQPFKGHEGESIMSLAFSPTGSVIASGGLDGTISLWDLEGNPLQGHPLIGHVGAVSSVVLSPDGKTIFSSDDKGTIRVWDRDGYLIGQPFTGHKEGVSSAAFSPDGKTIVSGGEDNTIRLWDTTSGKPIGQPFKGHTDWVSSVAWSPDGKTIVSGSLDKTIRLWDTSGNPIGQPFKGHTKGVKAVAFSPDGKTIVSGSADKTIRLWDTSGNPIGQPFERHKKSVNSVAFSPDGKTIVSGGSDWKVSLWDTSGNPIGQPFQGHKGAVFSAVFSPDGKMIVSGSKDKTIRRWKTSGEPVGKPFRGHTNFISSVKFSPDGKTIVSGSSDNTIRLWNASGGLNNPSSWKPPTEPIGQRLKGHTQSVNSVAFSPDGKTIISGSTDGTLRKWRVGTWQDWLKMACNRIILHPVLVAPEKLLVGDVGKTLAAEGARKTCQTRVWNDAENAQFLLNQGRSLAQQGDFSPAIKTFQQAKKLSPSIKVPAEDEVKQWAVKGLIEQGENLVQEGKVQKAVDAFEKAKQLDATSNISQESWDTLCWYGALHGGAKTVISACDTAVALAPGNGDVRDSRGVARALTGDTPGAIADFQAFIEGTDSAERKKRRQGWIDALKKGENPFTEKEIAELLE
ncbi:MULTISPECIES: TIR domain-containing protein [unclassified Microcoleus]|uniref:TIR domain-containing protein n=1 Tax=unclassified Microcoleus TaxID=2642155 RepID=UPI002FD3A2D2